MSGSINNFYGTFASFEARLSAAASTETRETIIQELNAAVDNNQVLREDADTLIREYPEKNQVLEF